MQLLDAGGLQRHVRLCCHDEPFEEPLEYPAPQAGLNICDPNTRDREPASGPGKQPGGFALFNIAAGAGPLTATCTESRISQSRLKENVIARESCIFY